MTATDVVVALNETEVLKLDFQHGARVLRALDLDRTWIVRARHLSTTRPQTAPNSLQWLTARSNEAAPGHSQAASRCRSTSSAASFGHMISGWVVMRTVALVYVFFTSTGTVLTTAICRFRPSPAQPAVRSGPALALASCYMSAATHDAQGIVVSRSGVISMRPRAYGRLSRCLIIWILAYA